MTKREELLQQACLACCHRYGTEHPEDCFQAIAEMWSAYVGVKLKPSDVCLMMALLKVVRVKHGYSVQDSLVDLAGYAACASETWRNE